MKLINLISILLLLLILNSCTKSSILGSDIIEQDKLNVIFTDTVGLIGSSEVRDSILVYEDSTSTFNPQFKSLANMDDPILGNTNSSIVSQLVVDNRPNFKTPTVDSAFMYLAFPKIGKKYYGDTTMNMNIKIYQLKDDLTGTKKVYSNKKVSIEPTPIGTLDYKVNPNKVQSAIASDSFYVKVPISPSFYTLLLDTSKYTNATVFNQWIKGIIIKSETTNKCGLIFDMYSNTCITSMRLYFKNASDTVKYTAIYKTTAVIFNTFQNNRTGAPVNDFLNNTAKGDSLLFVQSTAGVDIKLQFPTLKNLKKVIINKAEIILPMRDNPTDFTPVAQLVATYKKSSDGTFTFIPDIINGGSVFEGTVDLKNGQYFYRLNISQYIQKVINEGLDPSIYINAESKQQTLNRSIIQGVKNSKASVKLNLIYTNY
jgi:hypothetical protein